MMETSSEFEYVKCKNWGWIHRVSEDDEAAEISSEQRQRYAKCTRCKGVVFESSSWADVPVLANTAPFVRNKPFKP